MPAPDPNAPLLHPTPRRRDRAPSPLQVFTTGLAHRLPGSWSAATEGDFAYSPAHAEVIDRLWDHGHAHWALEHFVPHEAALLDGPGNALFVVLPRPRRPGQFLLAALAPPGIDGQLCSSLVPHGIAVPGDPVRAASDVERRLLPRYRQAVEAVRGPALREAHRLAQKALDDWDAVLDSLCDAAGMPLDENAYGARQAQRDTAAWLPFETFLFHGPAAIDHAKAALPTLPLPASTADRWSYQLGVLTGALSEGIRIRDTWESRLAALLDDQVGPDRWVAFNNALDDRNAEGWDAMTDFIAHGHVLHAIDNAEQQRAESAAARVDAARARSTIVPAHRTSARPPAPDAPRPAPGPPARPHTPGH